MSQQCALLSLHFCLSTRITLSVTFCSNVCNTKRSVGGEFTPSPKFSLVTLNLFGNGIDAWLTHHLYAVSTCTRLFHSFIHSLHSAPLSIEPGGPVHYSCLNRWNSCCELRCRMLASVLVPSAGLSVPQIPGLLANATAAMQDGLLTLYRCPQCGQCTLSQMVINEVGKLTQVMYFLIKHVSSSIKQMKHFYALNPTNRTGLNSGHGTNLTYHCPNKWSSSGVETMWSTVISNTSNFGFLFRINPLKITNVIW